MSWVPCRGSLSDEPLRIALVTSRNHADLYSDDHLLLEALRSRGHEVTVEVWDDDGVIWDAYDAAIIRSTWDYAYSTERRDEYVAWARHVEKVGCRLLNSADVVEENTHKRYMLELAGNDLPVVPTVLLGRGSDPDLEAILLAHEWDGFVVKPAVGASGRNTVMGSRGDVGKLGVACELVAEMIPNEDILVQPFMETIGPLGETSYMWIDGAFTHAVNKRAKPGEFRVQDDHGGTVERVDLEPSWLRVAESLVAPYADDIVYARVDLVPDDEGRPLLMELELTEPEMFFRFDETSVARFADAVERMLVAA